MAPPATLIARIRTDSAWNTEEALVQVHRSRTHHLAILVREVKWHVDGLRRSDLDGCRDIDLGWTPASNLLPVRRLGLQIGDETTIDAAWLRFPDLELQRTAQTYTRLSARTWRYRAGAADHLLSGRRVRARHTVRRRSLEDRHNLSVSKGHRRWCQRAWLVHDAFHVAANVHTHRSEIYLPPDLDGYAERGGGLPASPWPPNNR